MPSTKVDALLLRGPASDQGTYGMLIAPGFACNMLELPDRNNERQYSRIPTGVYKVNFVKSPKFGWVYQVTDVPGRGNILIHPGNYAGDVRLQYKTHSHGCLLPCGKRGSIDGQRAGLISAPTVAALVKHFKKRSFIMEVKDA